MQVCYQCNADPNFICRCSNPAVFSCSYHYKDHDNHPEFKFFYSKSLERNLEETLQKLESFKNEIDLRLEELAKTVNDLITSLSNQLENATSVLYRSKNDIESAVNILKNIQPNQESEYLSIFKILVDLNLPMIENTLEFQNNSYDILKVFNKFIKVKSSTENLLKKEDFFYFDEDFFKFEMKKAELKEIGIQCWEKSDEREINDLTFFTNHMMKRMHNFLHLTGNNITFDLDVTSKISAFSCKNHRFIIKQFDVDDECYLKLINLLEPLEYIEHLNITESISGKDRLEIFCNAIRNKRAIKYIVLKNNTITASEISSVLDSFKNYSQRIRSINLSENFFSSEGAKILNSYLPMFRRLRELSIANNDIGTDGALHLMENLTLLKELEQLNARSNDLRAQGIEYIMQGIFMLPHLSVLYLCDNNAGEEGAIIISKYMKYLKMLTVLFVDNSISADAERVLLACCNPYTKIMKWVDKATNIVIKRPVFR